MLEKCTLQLHAFPQSTGECFLSLVNCLPSYKIPSHNLNIWMTSLPDNEQFSHEWQCSPSDQMSFHNLHRRIISLHGELLAYAVQGFPSHKMSSYNINRRMTSLHDELFPYVKQDTHSYQIYSYNLNIRWMTSLHDEQSSYVKQDTHSCQISPDNLHRRMASLADELSSHVQ